MIGKILPIVFLIAGVAAGIGVGAFLVPGPIPVEQVDDNTANMPAEAAEAAEEESNTATEFIRMSNQFVIPIVNEDTVTALVVVSLILEARNGLSEAIYSREPKLRDAFLRVLFDHANMGGFQGAFTQTDILGLLRTALRETAQKEMGPDLVDVLIVDIVRQDT